ncbi:MAG: multicopper oxidase domain-containing protein [Candidatus Azambacteria bacterium]|nr:multicopper oxidase domain-containing protein [Candidatus Azambacteria bacterium]
MYTYLIVQILATIASGIAFVFLVRFFLKREGVRGVLKEKGFIIPALLLIVFLTTAFFSGKTYPPDFAMPPFMHSHAPGGATPSIPLFGAMKFFAQADRFEKVADISASTAVPPAAQKPDEDNIVRIELMAQEVIGETAPGIYFNYWTYNKQVPGPFLRVREGDVVEIALSNHPSSLHSHNIDLHAVTGPGGGAVLTNVAPGETKTFRWKALSAGLFIYHCALPNVSMHNSHGQYGLILVEPKEGMSPVDREFYVVQGELYTLGELGKKGLVAFDSEGLLDGIPNYVTFNGKVESVPRMQANTGEKIRMYVGNGGVNLISSFHVIGEIFDTVYPNASIGGALEKNTQTALVLPGGASIVEMTLEVPGKFLLVDHALARMNKGAWAVLEVSGDERPDIFTAVTSEDSNH